MSKCLMPGSIVVAMAAFVLIGTTWRAAAQPDQKDRQARTKEGQMMQCPMMSAMKDLTLHADSPLILLAMKEQLDLSEEQTERLEALISEAREQASKVLTEEQQEHLARAPQGPLSMMQVMVLLQKHSSGQQEQDQMCPMCMKMMRERMQQTPQGEAGAEHETHHNESQRRP